METPKPQVDKSEEKGVLALMQHFQKQAKDSYESSKAIFHQESLLPDNDTLQFLANQKRRLKLLSPPQEPPDPGPYNRSGTQSSPPAEGA
ncbi:Shikimate 5-dehydrogenase [Sesbania bispinosa]|nr:Shikimate 5-dehydrogenase [Sesbania bispinosa]